MGQRHIAFGECAGIIQGTFPQKMMSEVTFFEVTMRPSLILAGSQRMSRLNAFAVVAVIYLAISIIADAAGQTARSTTGANPSEVKPDDRDCPPFGRRMPPDELLLTMSTDQRALFHYFRNYAGEGRAMRASNDDLSVWFSLYFEAGLNMSGDVETIASVLPESGQCSIDSIIRDGFVTPLGGQIYRWTGEDLTLRRIPNHPLAHSPQDSIGLFHLAISNEAKLQFHLQRNPKGLLILRALEVKRGDPELNEADSVLFEIDPGSFEKGGFLFGPCREPNKRRRHPHWVRVGQFIETCQWRVKVLRVVHPDEKSKIDGWVDLRVEPRQQPFATDR